MEKVILYYKFVPVKDPETVRLWQRTLCEQLGLKGRVLISDKGINGTLGGGLKSLKAYVRAMHEHPSFKGIHYKWSDGSTDDFPKLVVKVRAETVTLGWDPAVNEEGIVDGGKHLKPEQVHELIRQRKDVVFFDGRNKYESAIGKFKNAVTPAIQNFRELPDELDKPEYDMLKNKPVVTYCTGGIRCESLSALMKQKGFKEVYQIDGGIVTYGEEFGDNGLWEGKCFVFDKRMQVQFSDKAKDIGTCLHCAANTSHYVNCANKSCNKLVLICEDCATYEGRIYCNETREKESARVKTSVHAHSRGRSISSRT